MGRGRRSKCAGTRWRLDKEDQPGLGLLRDPCSLEAGASEPFPDPGVPAGDVARRPEAGEGLPDISQLGTAGVPVVADNEFNREVRDSQKRISRDVLLDVVVVV